MILSDKFKEALCLAADLHRNQLRKGSDIPYISHLLAVASLVMEHKGNENEVIAALLHDAIEDQGGMETLDKIQERFGKKTADIVIGCSDAFTQPKPPWKQRKLDYLERLESASNSILLVEAADKLHNARSIYRDYKNIGEKIWTLFKGGKEGTLWYYRSLVNIFEKRGPKALSSQLKEIVSHIEILAKSTSGSTRCQDEKPTRL